MKNLFAILFVFFGLCFAQSELEKAKNAYEQKDFKTAFEHYQKGSDNGDLLSCYALALAYKDGDGVAKDSKKAFQIFEALCEKNIAGACFSLGEFFEKSEYKKANELYKKACASEHIGACYKLAGLLRSQNQAQKALKLYEKICQSGDASSCAFAGEMYEKTNANVAKKYYQKACELGLILVCQ